MCCARPGRGFPWAPRTIPEWKALGCAPTAPAPGDPRRGAGVPEGSERGCPPSTLGGSEGQPRASRALPREGGSKGAASRGRGLSHGPGVCARGGRRRRRMPSKERGPAKAPAPLTSLPTSKVTAGTPGAFPEPVSPVNSCCDVPSFLLSLSLCSVCYDSCLPVAANGRAHKTNHSPLPLGRETDNSSPALETTKAVPGFSPAHFLSGCHQPSSAQQVLPGMAGSNSKIPKTSAAKC